MFSKNVEMNCFIIIVLESNHISSSDIFCIAKRSSVFDVLLMGSRCHTATVKVQH